MRTKNYLAVLFLLLVSSTSFAQLFLPNIFTDNMVLQQRTDAPIWGKSASDEQITITTSWNKKTYSVKADTQGEWKTKITTPKAGGPYLITISSTGGESIRLSNVMIGEVWICSGQSNMEMQIEGWGKVYDYEKEKAAANYPNIRFFTVEKTSSTTPLEEASVAKNGWLVCDPQTVADFSATAYFFGRDIHQNQNVPVGLINTSYGGTIVEAWTSAEALEDIPYLAETVRTVKEFPTDRVEQQKVYAQQLIDWKSNLDKADIGMKSNWNSTGFGDSNWTKYTAPGTIESQGFAQFNGLFWCRKEVNIPKEWEGKALTLSLGNVDDIDYTYFNGVQIGNMGAVYHKRTYTIPAHLVKAGKAVIAVQVIDTGGDAGFTGNRDEMHIGLSASERISLANDWKIKTSTPLSELPTVPKDISANPNVPTVLFNAMINPLIPYALRGGIWYQGESNENNPDQYKELFPLMIQDWRSKWGYDFPFYFVQLANFTELQTEPTEASWNFVREAQLNTLHLQNTGMAVAIDIGDAYDIHPKNKKDVGLRLALNARANTYGEKIPYSGPIYNSYLIEGNTIRISFNHTDKGLKTKDNQALKGFTIAGPDRKFHWAEARIEGNEIIVSSPNVPYPMAVRYAWAQNPLCNLYNGVELPASPFRTDTW